MTIGNLSIVEIGIFVSLIVLLVCMYAIGDLDETQIFKNSNSRYLSFIAYGVILFFLSFVYFVLVSISNRFIIWLFD